MEQHWLVRPRTIRMLWVVFAVLLAATVVAELFVPHEAHFWYDRLFGFGAWYGFLACAALILAAKVLGVGLKRPDTYYEDADRDA